MCSRSARDYRAIWLAALRLASYLQETPGIGLGETTADGLFTLQTVQCLAACGSSPAMRVNDALYENLTFDRVDQILQELRGD